MRPFNSILGPDVERLLDDGVLVWVVSIVLTNGEAFFLTPNNRNVLYLGRTYQAAKMELGELNDSGEGDLPGSSLTIANIGRVAMRYLESVDRPWDQARVIYQIAAVGMPDVETGVRFETNCQGAVANHKVVTLTLGSANWFGRSFPGKRYLRSEGYPGIPRNVQ